MILGFDSVQEVAKLAMEVAGLPEPQNTSFGNDSILRLLIVIQIRDSITVLRKARKTLHNNCHEHHQNMKGPSLHCQRFAPISFVVKNH